MNDPRALLGDASRLRQAGDLKSAAALLQTGLRQHPDHPAGWNLLGIIQIEAGDPAAAAMSIERAIEIDPAPPLLLNLARAHRAAGDQLRELEALDRALSADAYFLPAILDKGVALRALGREAEAVELYRLVFEGMGDTSQIPASLAGQLEEAREFLRLEGDRKMERFSEVLDEVRASAGDDLRRAQAYAENRAGKRRIYQQRPTGSHFPFLPAIEFFDRSMFPWFEEFEKHTEQ